MDDRLNLTQYQKFHFQKGENRTFSAPKWALYFQKLLDLQELVLSKSIVCNLVTARHMLHWCESCFLDILNDPMDLIVQFNYEIGCSIDHLAPVMNKRLAWWEEGVGNAGGVEESENLRMFCRMKRSVALVYWLETFFDVLRDVFNWMKKHNVSPNFFHSTFEKALFISHSNRAAESCLGELTEELHAVEKVRRNI